MYTHKRFFVSAGLSGLWYGAIELAGYLGWYWLVVVLLALPCVLCFGLWMRLEEELTLRKSVETERRDCAPKMCGTCDTFKECREKYGFTYGTNGCKEYRFAP